MKKLNKIISAGLAVALAGTLCGCSVEFGTRKEPAKSAVVAHPTSADYPEDMNIKYGDFSKEYKLLLVNNNILDDQAEGYAAACEQQRYTIIHTLINERILHQKAKEFGVYELSDEQKQAVEKEYNDTIDQLETRLGEYAAAQTSDTELSDEEKKELGAKELDKRLEQAGMEREYFRTMMESSLIITNLEDYIIGTVERSKAEEKLKELQNTAEELYKSNKAMYENSGYGQIPYTDMWLPSGARKIKHVLLSFDSETQTEIRSLRSEGKDGEADKLRDESAEKLKEKREEIEKKYDDGTSIDDLISEYNTDPGVSTYPDGYTVIPDGTTFVEEFQTAAFVPEKIGDRTFCVTDYGVHIMVYAADAKISDSSLESIADEIYTDLQAEEFSTKMSEWADEYAYEIDYDALRLTDPNATSDSTAEDESSDAE